MSLASGGGGKVDVTMVDVIVRFVGTLQVPRPLMPDEVFPERLLTKHRQKPGRGVMQISRTTVTIREDSVSLISAHLKTIKEALKDHGVGKVCVYGSSSGGRNALAMAATLTDQQIPVAYVAAIDAAFFPNEAINNPDNFTDEPTVIPRFNAGYQGGHQEGFLPDGRQSPQTVKQWKGVHVPYGWP